MAAKRKFSHKSKKPGETSGKVRVLVECSPHRITGGGFFPGLTTQDIEHESSNERDALGTLVLCHDVKSISSQASKEPYSASDGSDHVHIPDFTVDTFVPDLRIEVKSLTSLLKNTSIEKYIAVAKGYLDRHVPFALLVDAQLREEPRFSSMKLLFRYVGGRVPEGALARATDILRSGPLTISELKDRARLELVDVWTMVARRHLCFDWATPLDAETTLISLPEQPFEGLKLEDILRSTRFGPLLAELAVGRGPKDQRLLADAATWRQHRRPPTPFQFVGGFSKADPLRDIREEEHISRNPRCKRDYAPGNRSLQNGNTTF